ncbi:uncharacterized protein LOC119641324 isoform X3 [Glossina fuscipes]|uniref:Uncharacterized protein LOC119641324 isoform X3 n=1 Tax=Glossina fuscipes TaxID=7396 RepID=A0A9C5ZGF9_9MUSC|nr:uncharacterized protein LOC119641324 isoform X3 [Glossina fuscipes]
MFGLNHNLCYETNLRNDNMQLTNNVSFDKISPSYRIQQKSSILMFDKGNKSVDRPTFLAKKTQMQGEKSSVDPVCHCKKLDDDYPSNLLEYAEKNRYLKQMFYLKFRLFR